MNRFTLAIASLACASTATMAFDNEAVTVQPDGTRKVELPPGPHIKALRNIERTTDPWPPGTTFPAFVIETDKGLVECPLNWVDSACREYRPGRDKRPRSWVQKHKGQWLLCPDRGSEARCAAYDGLPNHKVQE